MGSGIAQVAASNGCQVTIVDSFPQALETSKSKLKSILNRLVEKGKINQEKSQLIISNIKWTTEMKDISPSNLVFEAIVENMEIQNVDQNTNQNIRSTHTFGANPMPHTKSHHRPYMV